MKKNYFLLFFVSVYFFVLTVSRFVSCFFFFVSCFYFTILPLMFNMSSFFFVSPFCRIFKFSAFFVTSVFFLTVYSWLLAVYSCLTLLIVISNFFFLNFIWFSFSFYVLVSKTSSFYSECLLISIFSVNKKKWSSSDLNIV